ncbi:MAG TPA: sulfite exporter TauE/SafE family protein [Myxococcaceae bacterium]|nr:sulfite exporter TauE/SafE family protein [Myxococcaceae bacterium]
MGLAPAEVALDVLLGAAIGVLSGIVGIGGGLFVIPLLGVFFGMTQQRAQGTSLVMVVPNVLLGLWRYARYQGFDPRGALVLALSAPVFTYVGARVATAAPSGVLRVAFGCFLLALAGFYGLRSRSGEPRIDPDARIPGRLAVSLGVLGGLTSGLFGVGGSLLTVPLMTTLRAMGQATAQGMGLALVAPGTVVNLLVYGRAGNVDWARGIALALGGVATMPLGVAIAHRLPERVLRVVFGTFALISAVGLFLRH